MISADRDRFHLMKDWAAILLYVFRPNHMLFPVYICRHLKVK